MYTILRMDHFWLDIYCDVSFGLISSQMSSIYPTLSSQYASLVIMYGTFPTQRFTARAPERHPCVAECHATGGK